MINYVTKYGIMIIAAVLLVAMAFAGVASADSITINNASDWQEKLAGKVVTEDVILNGDIDLSGVSNPMIKSLSRSFDGKNHTVSNFVINNDTEDNIGLIGNYTGSEIKDVILGNFSVTGGSKVGGLIGNSSGETHIENVHVEFGNVSGSGRVGGVVGSAESPIWVNESSAERMYIVSSGNDAGGLVGSAGGYFATNGSWVDVSEIRSSSGSYVGGLVGYASGEASFAKVLSKDCKIWGSTGAGGLVGYLNDTGELIVSTVENCTISIYGYNGAGGMIGLVVSSGKTIDCDGSWVNYTWVTEPNMDFEKGSIIGKHMNVNNNPHHKEVYSNSMNHVGGDKNVDNTFNGTEPTIAIGSKIVLLNFQPGVEYGYRGGLRVAYDNNSATSGTVPAKQTYKRGTTVTVAEQGDIKKDGCEFNGWNTEKDGSGTNYKHGDTFTIDDDVTLYANWSAIPYNITYYNLTGATNPKTNPITYNVTSVITLDNASKMGYTFEGWYNSTEFTEENKTNTIPKGSFGDKVFYANWTVNSTTGTVIDNKAEFGNNNITAINSTSGGIVTKVLLENVSKVKNDKNVVFTAANTTLHIPDYDRNTTDKEITVFEIISSVVDSSGYALITVKVTFNDEENATINENKILFSHYNTTIKEWDKTPLVRASYRNGKNVTYVVQTKSFSPFGVGIYTPIVDPSPSSGGGSSKHSGSTIILQDGVITSTIAPTDAPTVKPTEKTGTSIIIATEKPTTQPTQQSPAPALGILAGFGAAALVLTRMKR